jgi:hypothetical protein
MVMDIVFPDGTRMHEQDFMRLVASPEVQEILTREIDMAIIEELLTGIPSTDIGPIWTGEKR